ncbi:MAG TPA: glycosyltransferase family 87 protein [Tepidisphaeraceae bacterium]|nr:glycosyltransferase family 87 protein [Tepidisphaeraceae bacterium]
MLTLLAGLFVDARHRINKSDTGAFSTYWEAARDLRDGRDPYGRHVGAYSYVYPPLYALLCRPLATMPLIQAARIMLVINTAFVLAALLLTSRSVLERLSISTSALNVLGVAFGAALLAAVPLHNELRGMETNALLLLSFALGLYWLDRRPGCAGLALAVAINIKYLPVLAIPYMLLRRRWAAAAATALWSAALALLPALFIGWTTNLRYLRMAVGGLGNLAGTGPAAGSAHVNQASVLSSISITSTFARLAEGLGWPSRSGLALGAAAAACCGLMAVVAYRRRRLPLLLWPAARAQTASPFQALVAIEWAGLVTGILAFSPNTQNRNLVLAVIPAVLAVVLLRFPRGGLSRRPVVIAVITMLVALILPIAAMGHENTGIWQHSGMPCWCLLAAYAVLLVVGLKTCLVRVDGTPADLKAVGISGPPSSAQPILPPLPPFPLPGARLTAHH